MTKEEARLSVMGAISMALKAPVLQQGFEIICKNLAELEKENAELEKKIGIYQKGMYNEIEKRDKKLTKAKEIIKLFVQWNYGCCKEPDYKNLVKQAEQFLEKVK